jgi:hypothetical protein
VKLSNIGRLNFPEGFGRTTGIELQRMIRPIDHFQNGGVQPPSGLVGGRHHFVVNGALFIERELVIDRVVRYSKVANFPVNFFIGVIGMKQGIHSPLELVIENIGTG